MTPNGAPPTSDRSHLQEALTGEPLTQGYQPSLPSWFLAPDISLPQLYLLRDVELMIVHPIVRNALDYFAGGISGAEFDGESENQEVGDFVIDQCQRFWDRGVPLLQGAYPYGWIGCEAMYTDDEGPLKWDRLIQFSPRDTFPLTQDSKLVGVRVKNIRSTKPNHPGRADLWTDEPKVPSKGLWYAHQPRYQSLYGQSQLLGAWRPWRRLAWKDAAETVLDTGAYRFAFSGPVVRYPNESSQVAAPGVPATSLDDQGRPRRHARDVARQIAEWFKSGAGVGLSSEKYPAEMGGGDKWSLEFCKQGISLDGLIAYCKHLFDQIYFGIGVPPEILQASETGSGYSGRAIPLEAFLAIQQRIADALLHLFVEQILKPLVYWNWGKGIKFEVKVKPLLESKSKSQQGQTPETQPDVGAMPGAGGPGADVVPAQLTPGGGQGGNWSPYQGKQGQQGWRSQGGAVRYQQAPPGSGRGVFSLENATPRILEIARRILRRVA